MCDFCKLAESGEGWVLSSEHFFVISDRAPVTEGHMLIVSKRHVPDIFHLPQEVMESLWVVIHNTWATLQAMYRPDGYNLGTNVGEAAGQTRMHFHMHVIPRRKGDVPDPRGGIRNIIPNPIQKLWPE